MLVGLMESKVKLDRKRKRILKHQKMPYLSELATAEFSWIQTLYPKIRLCESKTKRVFYFNYN